MNRTKIVLLGVLSVVLLIALAIGSEFVGLAWKGYFKPKHQAVERSVFTQSKSFVAGKAQELGQMYGEYMQAPDASGKAAVTALVRIQFAEFNADLIDNASLRRFLSDVQEYRIP